MVFSFLLSANVLVRCLPARHGSTPSSADRLGFAPTGLRLTMAIMYVALNLLIDVLYVAIDPRMRIEASASYRERRAYRRPRLA